MSKPIKGLVVNDAISELETILKYGAKCVRIPRHYDNLTKDLARLGQELRGLQQNNIDWILVTGHSLGEENKSSGIEHKFKDLFIFLDRWALKYPKLVILGNETNELQLYWHSQASALNKKYPKCKFVPQAATSLAENAGYKTLTEYLKNDKIQFNKDIALHFYLRPTWKVDSSLTNLQRVNKLIDILELIRENNIENIHIMESHDADVENEGGDLVISSKFGNRILYMLAYVFNISSIFHYNGGSLNKSDTTILNPNGGKKDILGAVYTIAGIILLFPYTLWTFLRIVKYNAKKRRKRNKN